MLTIILSYGLFLPVALYFYYMDIRHILNRRTARKDLAGAAEELGLARKKGGNLGTWEGRIDGYFVRVTADEHTKITVMLKTKCDAWLMRTNRLERLINGKSMADSYSHMTAFSFGNGEANRLFHYRYAAQDTAEALKRADTSVRLLAELAGKWRWTMGQMSLTRESITASPSRGTMKKCHSITGRQLGEFLPDLVALARMWDSLPELHRERTREK